ncbi:triose-phosphate isomerase [Fluviispira multicolorata]|uniref:Triosephosphate isomerase n=1 Tax=Fluviispira multicolorata TaxID=2654512 RepID=A0A833JGT4_9BACT|nr:triose-phosphate isomerase [Fluviispira multicolorata]KAB8033163.1 triose-phosphate isomerase [Fluviispira multicolorata]
MTMQRKKMVIGNWKMFKSASQASSEFSDFAKLIATKKLNIDVGIAAPSVFLADLARRTQNSVTLFAQNAHWANEGAFTGEISTGMLQSILVNGSLVAHSERRQMFGETDESAGKRVGALVRSGMKAVLCIGETLAERESGMLKQVLTRQIEKAIEASGIRSANEFIGSNPSSPLLSLAYEPVWAIGTGKAASPVEAQDAHAFIREVLSASFNKETSSLLQILYGGSVKLNNVKDYMACPDVDGALVGGASLIAKDFSDLCEKCD